LSGDVDAVIGPTTPRPAPRKEEAELAGGGDLIRYTIPFDLNACPSISVPAGFTKAGLPVGVMLSARPFDEPRLLGLAYAYQQETRFGERRPPAVG
jgi:aspartyl-tRNA(Asn)/glutamyl-tRNA(Gln) amidotransferase subunit A